EGQASFAPQWRPRKAELVRTGAQPRVVFELAEDGADRWKVTSRVSGGTANGQIALRQGEDGRLQLTGQVAPDKIDVASALDAFKVHSPLRGKVSGQTQLSATGTNPAEIALSLRTHTAFSVSPATLLNVDVDKAIHSLGADHAGQTSLRSLTGQINTTNTPDGMVVRFTGLQAQGDSFTAKGGGTIARRQVEGQMTVDVAHGLVGVPLRVSGPVADPHVSVQAGAATGAAAGAAIGTAVLPGVGTAVGAGLGGIIGKLFKPHEPPPRGGRGP
ncbi:MAG: glycine zipper domain-containing protein, partial [Ramlibacter sp.]